MIMVGSTLLRVGALVLLCLLCLFHSTLAAEPTRCYASNGVQMDPRYVPCISVEGVDSVCCRLNGTDPDICKPNGLCWWDDINSQGEESRQGYYRSVCTRHDWNTTNCLDKDLCQDSSEITAGTPLVGVRLTECSDGSFCCGNSTDCCTAGNTFPLNPTLMAIAPSSNSSSAPTVTATVSNEGDSSTKLAIGLGVGIPLAVVAIVGAGGGFLWGRRSMKAKVEQIQDNGGFNIPRQGALGAGPPLPEGIGHFAATSKPVYEADAGRRQPTELPAGVNYR